MRFVRAAGTAAVLGFAIASVLSGNAFAQSGPTLGYNAMARTNQGDDIGHNNGYSTVGLLLGTLLDRAIDSGFFFLDLRGHIENNGNIAYNLGGGWRYVDWGASDKGVYGIHAGFDGRRYECQAARTCKEETFHWFNLGLERLGDRIDVRGNAYFNAGNNRKYYGLTAVGFEGNTLQVAKNYAEALWGFDGEVGGRFAFGSDGGFKAYAALGGYHFDARESKDATGVRARFEIEPVQYVSLGVRGSIDDRFDTSIMGRATIKFGQPPRSDRASDVNNRPALARLIEFRERQELIVADDGVSRRERTLTDATGAAVPFVHVDNTAPEGGNGTYESRYNQLADINGAGTNPGDIIILYEGDGTTALYDQGAALKANQYLLGQGAFGNYTFAQTPVWFTLPGGRPTITNVNPLGDALTLASGVIVDGIDVVGAQRHGFFADGIDGATIRNVSFRDNLSDGMFILNATGTVLAENNSCTGNGFRAPPHGPTEVDCIDVKSAATGNLDIIYRNNFVDNNYGNGLEASALSSDRVTMLFEGNTVTRSTEGGIGIEVGGSGGADVVLRNNLIADNGWQGILFASNAPVTQPVTLSITNNLVLRNGTTPETPPIFGGAPVGDETVGIYVSSFSSTVVADISNNIVADNVGTGIYLGADVANANTSLIARVTNNTITGNGAANVGVNSYDSGIVGEAFTHSGFTARLDLLVQDNVLSGNAPYGASLFTLTFDTGAAIVCSRVVGNSGTNGTHRLSQNGIFSIAPGFDFAGGGTFNLEPSTGTFTTVGTITNVPLGTCNY
jgi:hypothetical protein